MIFVLLSYLPQSSAIVLLQVHVTAAKFPPLTFSSQNFRNFGDTFIPSPAETENMYENFEHC